MAVRHGYGKIAGTDALVFAYDTGDTRNSYRGEPTENLISPEGQTFTQITTYSDMSHTQVVDSNSPSGYACEMEIASLPVNSSARARFGFAAGIPTSGTAYVTIYAKFEGGTAANIRPSIYSGAVWQTMVPLDGGSIYLTNEYRRFGVLATLGTNSGGPNPGFSMTRSNSGEVVGQKTRWHSPQVEIKSHATPFVNGTRSATQGLLDLTGNSTIDLSNLDGYNANAEIDFDGTNDRVEIAHNSSVDVTGAEVTFEQVIKKDTNGNFTPLHKELQYTLRITSANQIQYSDSSGWNYSGFGGHNMGIVSGDYFHLVTVKKDGIVTIYVNNSVVVSKSWGSSITSTTNNLFIGSYAGSSNFMNGQIPVTKIYNRALTPSEVQSNYRHYKKRFNI